MMTSATLDHGIRTNKLKIAALWVLQIAAAGMFLFAGYNKLSGNPQMVQVFDAIGIGQWFRYLTGAIEVGSAVLMFIPSLTAFGALLLTATMLGAIITHVFIIGGSPAPAVVFFVISLIILYARRHTLLAIVRK
jgi:uncharacterized membrane protein YphA (DoxX/SURF4 family)